MACPNSYLLYSDQVVLNQAGYNITIAFSDIRIVENIAFQLLIDQGSNLLLQLSTLRLQ